MTEWWSFIAALALIDWGRVVGIVIIGVAAGGATLVEMRLALLYPLRAGRWWLFVGFVVDGVFTVLAYEVLVNSLKEGFFGEPISVFLIALFFAPLILRARIELLAPLGERGPRFFSALMAGRARISLRLSRAQAGYWEHWITHNVIPKAEGADLQAFAARARSFAEGAAVDASEQDKLTEAIDTAELAMSASKIAWLILRMNGLDLLEDFTGVKG